LALPFCAKLGSRPTDAAKEKSRPQRRLLNSNLMIVDQAAINAGFDFWRYFSDP